MKLGSEFLMFVGNQFVKSSDENWKNVENPSTGEIITKIPEATPYDVDRAVGFARKAFKTYRLTTPVQRAELLNKIADIIEKNTDLLAYLESIDTGKPIRDTKNIDIPLAADHFRYFAAAIRTLEGSSSIIDKDLINMVLYEPMGVIGQIVPWNFPFLISSWKIAPALAAGNAIVFKPSSSSSLSILMLMRLISDILPEGLINVITGSGSKSGEYLQKSKGIDKLAFTGSTEVGREVALSAADKIIPSTLELGGKSANIFFADASFDQAIEGVKLGILYNQGQTCSAGSRIFVQEDFCHKFIPKLVDEFKKIRVGNPLDFNTQMGALISKHHLDMVKIDIKRAQAEGAELLTGGNRIYTGGLEKGYFLEPTLLLGTNNMKISRKEIFGPVGTIIPFKDEDDLIEMVNDSMYGLGGGIFTKDISRAFRVAKAIETGRIWINTYSKFPAGAPFGGYKQSGIGREMHKMTLKNYCQIKNIIINTNDEPMNW